MTQLTQHFTFEDLTKTSKVEFQDQNIESAKKCMEQLKLMAQDLEVVFSKFPLVVTSSFRCLALNKSFGSQDYSQHRYGKFSGAADFVPTKNTLDEVFKWIYESSNLKFHQLTLENGGGKTWIHMGRPKEYQDGQVFKLDPVTKVKTWICKPQGMA